MGNINDRCGTNVLKLERTSMNTNKRLGLPWWLSGGKSAYQMQETQVSSLIWEDSICHGATKPVSYNY